MCKVDYWKELPRVFNLWQHGGNVEAQLKRDTRPDVG